MRCGCRSCRFTEALDTETLCFPPAFSPTRTTREDELATGTYHCHPTWPSGAVSVPNGAIETSGCEKERGAGRWVWGGWREQVYSMCAQFFLLLPPNALLHYCSGSARWSARLRLNLWRHEELFVSACCKFEGFFFLLIFFITVF